MADDLESLEEWAAPLIERLEVTERRRLTRKMATELRRSQRERIRDQKNPDGSPYEPRKRLRGKSGGIRRRVMFYELSKARWLKVKSTTDSASVGFFGRVARIARIHQQGERDRVGRDGPVYHYPQRELLGFSERDRALIRDMLIDHISGV